MQDLVSILPVSLNNSTTAAVTYGPKFVIADISLVRRLTRDPACQPDLAEECVTMHHSGISTESILLIVGQPASYDAGIRGKPLCGFS